MRRAALFLSGVVAGLIAAFYGAWFALYWHLTHSRRFR